MAETLAQFERARRLGLGPEMLADGLEGAASPLEVDPATLAAQEEAFARQEARIKTDDYRRERALYRVAQRTGTPVEELMQQPEWAGVGDARAGESVVPMRARAAMAQTRMDDENARMQKWKSQMMLASSNSRANMSNAFDMLSPEQKQRVIEARLTGGRNYQDSDPRMAIAQLEAETRRAEGQEARASQAEIAEANRIAAREEREGVRASEELRYGAQREEARAHNASVLKQGDDKLTLMLEEMKAAAERERGARELGLEKLRGELAALTTNAATSTANAQTAAQAQVEAARLAAEAAAGPAALALQRMTQDDDKRKDAMRSAFAANNPGAYHAAIGLQTPEAEEYLKNAASAADSFQWLPGGGFGSREAGSMNSALLALARQAEMSGVPNRLGDRAYREELIRRYGYASGWSGGRGGWFGDFWQPIPNDPPLAPQ
jgi:hypothetical protein